jgi:NTP pyrophosphatase (non-canonical NTP hydrolase)
MVDTKDMVDANPWWHPITDAVDLKHLGKLGEECGELSSAIARCIIQGIDEAEPVTGKVNREWLEDEIADVLANIRLVSERFKLDESRMARRADRKQQHLRQWHNKA